MSERDLTVISRIENEIQKIDNKESNVYFFVIDTKGNPSGSLEYIYKLAYILRESGFNVSMLYQEPEEFIGVGDWLDERFSSIPHYNIEGEDVSVSASDILFIPEIFANIMMQTKKLPCKRIAIMQNFDFVLEQMPISSQWGDLGIMEAICNTKINSELIKSIFPYVKTTVVDPYIDSKFGTTSAPKSLIINIVSKDHKDVNRIIKPFYWKYPMLKWVSFRDLRGFPQDMYADLLREGAITIWCDDETNFGYSALEAMKSGSLVLAKVTKETQEWMKDGDTLSNCCVWFDSFQDLHKMIASVVRAWITDQVPSEISEAVSNQLEMYSYEKTKEQIVNYVNNVLDVRKSEMLSLITHINTNTSENE